VHFTFGGARDRHVRASQAGKAHPSQTVRVTLFDPSTSHLSVRAWRGLRRNDVYAAKLEKKLARKTAAEEARRRAETDNKNVSTANPFSVSLSIDHPSRLSFFIYLFLKQLTTSSPLDISGVLGIGTHLFGAQPPPSLATSPPHHDDGHDSHHIDDAEDDSSASDDELLTAMGSVSLIESPWTPAPSYPPIYLSTVPEYPPPQPKQKLPAGARISDPLPDGDKHSKDTSWAAEAYENSLELDHVFERFTKRIAYEGQQCVR